MKYFLDFEQPIAELQAKIEELRMVSNDSELNISEEIKHLEEKIHELTESTFSDLTPWQITQVARHQMRPLALDYFDRIFTDFDELHGDRHSSDDPAIVAGLARFNNRPVALIGQHKGRSTKEKLHRNFGMAHPQGYRKALRVMELAEKFNMPIITFIDTNGAYPGIKAEETNQSEAIAKNLLVMSRLNVPIICIVIGEGGSGGALALGVGDVVCMLQYSIYSVISPEGCASILWKDATKASDAAAALKFTAHESKKLDLIDEVIPEPLGGAHRNYDEMAANVKESISKHLDKLTTIPKDELLEQRYIRLINQGFQHVDEDI